MKNRRPLGLSLDIRQAEKIFEDESEQQESKSYTGLKTSGDHSFKCTLSNKFNLQNQNQIDHHNTDNSLSQGEEGTANLSAASPDVTENLSVIDRREESSVVYLGRSPQKEKATNDISQIDENIYISSWRTAQQLDLLREIGITHVINLIAHKQDKPAAKQSQQTIQVSALECSFRDTSSNNLGLEEYGGAANSSFLGFQTAAQDLKSSSCGSYSQQLVDGEILFSHLEKRTTSNGSGSIFNPPNEQQQQQQPPSRNTLSHLSTENNIIVKEQLEGAPQTALDYNSLSCTNKKGQLPINPTQPQKRIYQNIQEAYSKKPLLFTQGQAPLSNHTQNSCPYENLSEYSNSQISNLVSRNTVGSQSSNQSPGLQRSGGADPTFSPYSDADRSGIKKQIQNKLQLPHHAKKPSGQGPASNRSAQQLQLNQSTIKRPLNHNKTNSMISSSGSKIVHNLSRNNKGVQPVLTTASAKPLKMQAYLKGAATNNQKKLQGGTTTLLKPKLAIRQAAALSGSSQLLQSSQLNVSESKVEHEGAKSCMSSIFPKNLDSSVKSKGDSFSEPLNQANNNNDNNNIQDIPRYEIPNYNLFQSSESKLPLLNLTQCPGEIEYLRLQMRDQADCDITLYVYQSIEFIQKALIFSGGKAKILIHCQQGNSRSAAIAASHFMYHKHMSDKEAIDYIRSKRRSIDPNIGFVGQLMVLSRKFQALRNKLNQEISNSSPIKSAAKVGNQITQVRHSNNQLQSLNVADSNRLDADKILELRKQANSSFSLLQEMNPSVSSRAQKFSFRDHNKLSTKDDPTTISMMFTTSASNRVGRQLQKERQRVFVNSDVINNSRVSNCFKEKRHSNQIRKDAAVSQKDKQLIQSDLFGPKIFSFCFKQRKIMSKNIQGKHQREESLQKCISQIQESGQLCLLVTEQFNILQSQISDELNQELCRYGINLLLNLAKLLNKFECRSQICYIIKSVKQNAPLCNDQQQIPQETLTMTKIEDIRNLQLTTAPPIPPQTQLGQKQIQKLITRTPPLTKKPLLRVSQLSGKPPSSLKLNNGLTSAQSLTQQMSKLMLGSPAKAVAQKLLTGGRVLAGLEQSAKNRAINNLQLSKHKHSQTSVYSSILNVKAQVKNNIPSSQKQSHTIKEKLNSKMSLMLYKDCEEIGLEDINLRSQLNNVRNSEHQKPIHKTHASTNLNISFINTDNSEQDNSIKNIFGGGLREGDRFFQPSTLQYFHPLRPSLSLKNPSVPQEKLDNGGQGSGTYNLDPLEGSFGYGGYGEPFCDGEGVAELNGDCDDEVSLINSNQNLNRTISMSDLIRLDQAQVILKSQEQQPSRNLCSPGI